MSAHRQCRTVRVRWRHAVALVPAVVLTASGVAIALTGGARGEAISLPAVPSQPLHQPSLTGSSVQPVTSAAQPAVPSLAPGLALPPGVGAGSAAPVRLDAQGIPRPALVAYRLAAQLVSRADPSCGIDWALVGAIGRVESDHARFGGNALDAAGVARPGIFGPPLNGTNGTARIADTDQGRWDHDSTYDRAVGPMQFIPGTWRIIGADADGDGVRNPQDMNDAATGTALYLCSGPGDLRRPGDLYQAVLRYNNSDTYVRTVIAIADAYRHGLMTLPASELPAAHQVPGGGSGVEAGEARPATSGSPAAPGAGNGHSGSAASGSGAGTGSATTPAGHVPSPTSAPDVVRAVAPATSAASSVVSLVTSVLTRVVPLPTPIVTTTTPCVVNVLGVRVCPLTTITSTTTTTTTTRTVTSTVTHRP